MRVPSPRPIYLEPQVEAIQRPLHGSWENPDPDPDLDLDPGHDLDPDLDFGYC